MPVVKLTPGFVASAFCPEGQKRIEYCDEDVPGLYLLVGAAGTTATFFLRYKNSAGKTCHAKIGRTSEVSLADARKQALMLKADIAAGSDPRAQELSKPAVLTFADFYKEHYLPHVKARNRSWAKDDGMFRNRIQAKFGDLALGQIARQQVQAFHTELRSTGLSAASCDHHVKFIRHALNLAVEWQMLEHNPIAGIRLFNEDNKVEHYLDAAQLERLLDVLNTDSCRSVCNVALFLLSTGARLNEALKATWDQIDKENRVWRIPASISKSKRIRSVPLNDSAIELLGKLECKDNTAYLFYSQKTGERLLNVHKVWDRLRKEANLPHLRIHDLRHQYASILVNSGRTLYEVQHILGHSDPQVTQRYAHLSTKSLQDAANSVSVMLKGVSASKEQTAVA